MEDLPNLVGQKIKNYKILKEIDRGSFGVVYIVEDENTEERYAMKILYPSDTNEAEFNREVAAYEILSSSTPSGSGCYKHIVCLRDAFINSIIIEKELPRGDVEIIDNIYYVLVLELMEGDIWGIIDSGLLLVNPYITLNLMKGLLEGLAFIHSKGLAHNDIKPDNILHKKVIRVIDDKERTKNVLKYVDFGLSCTDETQAELMDRFPKCGLEGSPLYISKDYLFVKPEEITLELAQKDDIWALGVVFRIMITGKHPIARIDELVKTSYTPREVFNVLYNTLSTQPFIYDTGNTKMDTIIKTVVQRMNAIDEEDRPTARELLDYIYENE